MPSVETPRRLVRLEWLCVSTIILLLVGAYCRIDQMLFTVASLGALETDSDQYLSGAGELLGITAPVIIASDKSESTFTFRTPGYPALLVAPLLLTKLNIPLTNAVIALHLSLFLAMMLVAIYALKAKHSQRSIIICILIAALPMRGYFFMLLSEWPAFCLLTIFLSLCVAQMKRAPSTLSLTLTATFAALIRPDYLILLPFAFVVSVIRNGFTIQLLRNFTLGIAPLALLIAINYLRFDRLTLAPVEGHQFVLTSIFSSEAEINHFAKSCSPVPDKIEPIVSILNPSAMDVLFMETERQIDAGLRNIATVQSTYQGSSKQPWSTINNCLMQLSGAIIATHFAEYLRTYLISCATVLWTVPFLILLWQRQRKARRYPPTFLFFLLALLVHNVHVFFVSAVNVMHFRYYITSFTPLLFGFLLAYFASADDCPDLTSGKN